MHQALKGAGAAFGIVTEFVVNTHPEPGDAVRYSFSLNFGKHTDMVPVVEQWMSLISDPALDRRLGSELVVHGLGAAITATFYGSEDEWRASGLPDRIPQGGASALLDGWLGAVAEQAEEAALYLSGLSEAFTASSVGFRREDLLSSAGIAALMDYIDGADRGPAPWFLIFDVTGGAIADVPMNATAYAHRDKIAYAQFYGGGPGLSQTTKDFKDGVFATIRQNSPGATTVYPGYVDPALDNAQEAYWGPNLPALMQIKAKYDPADLFHNPQSVRPASPGPSPRRRGGTQGR